jgi:hypothetical protein
MKLTQWYKGTKDTEKTVTMSSSVSPVGKWRCDSRVQRDTDWESFALTLIWRAERWDYLGCQWIERRVTVTLKGLGWEMAASKSKWDGAQGQDLWNQGSSSELLPLKPEHECLKSLFFICFSCVFNSVQFFTNKCPANYFLFLSLCPS